MTTLSTQPLTARKINHPLKEEEIKQLKGHLESHLEEIAKDLTDLRSIDLAKFRDCCGNDSADRANAMQEVENILRQTAEKERRQRKLQANLRRINEGIFDATCLGCAGQIPFGELLKDPASRFCSKPQCKKQEPFN